MSEETKGITQGQVKLFVSLVVLVFSFFQFIYKPQVEIQIRLAAIETKLSEIASNQKQVTTNTNEISVIKEQIKQLQGKN